MKRPCSKTANAASSVPERMDFVFIMREAGRILKVVIQDALNVPMTKEAVV